MIATEKLRTSAANRKAKRLEGESINLAGELSVAALTSVAAIPLAAFPEDVRKQAATELRVAAAAIRKVRNLIPRRGSA